MTSGDIFLLHQRRGGEGWGVISNKQTPQCWYAGPLMTACSTTRAPLGTCRASTFPTGRSCPARTTGSASDESSVRILSKPEMKMRSITKFYRSSVKLINVFGLFLILVILFSFAVWKIWEYLHMRKKRKITKETPHCLVPSPAYNVL